MSAARYVFVEYFMLSHKYHTLCYAIMMAICHLGWSCSFLYIVHTFLPWWMGNVHHFEHCVLMSYFGNNHKSWNEHSLNSFSPFYCSTFSLFNGILWITYIKRNVFYAFSHAFPSLFHFFFIRWGLFSGVYISIKLRCSLKHYCPRKICLWQIHEF